MSNRSRRSSVPTKKCSPDYRAGLKVPDDVTIVFPDDNFGYIRAFPSEQEQKRKGGFGVYYHISYLGRPLSYLWLNSTSAGAYLAGDEQGIREWHASALDRKRRRH
jgi:hypothetical protein